MTLKVNMKTECDRTPPFVAAQTVGGRDRQEDDFAILELPQHGRDIVLFVVADGMGGHKAAAEAAQLATRLFCEKFRDGDADIPDRLASALHHANEGIAVSGTRDPAFRGAGCTLVGAVVDNGSVSWISVGDSSLYHFRRGALRRLNTLHTGLARPENDAPGRNSKVLRSAVAGRKIEMIDHSKEPLRLIPGDCIILATDGLDCVDERKITSILRRSAARKPKEVAAQLLRAVHSIPLSRQDNTTIIFYRAPLLQGNREVRNLQWNQISKWTVPIIFMLLGIYLLFGAHWRLH
jgi:serine/threonine protein phosphatase PrpC